MSRHIRRMLKRFHFKDTLEVGIDEAGRGPLFGRVYVGAVILPQDEEFDHSLMRDSKKLNEKQINYNFIIISYNTDRPPVIGLWCYMSNNESMRST